MEIANKNIKPIQGKQGYVWEKNYPEGIKWNVDINPQPVFNIIDESVLNFPDNDAIDFLGKIYKYSELDILINKAAKGLQDLGVKKGIKVGLFLPNCPYSIIFYNAILKCGATVVNYNPLYVKEELEYQIEDSDTDMMVTMDIELLYAKMEQALANTRLNKLIICKMSGALPFPKNLLFPIVKRKDVAKIKHDKRHVWFDDLINNDGEFKPSKIDVYEDIAVLQYTGGTTGVPKGAMLTHANVYSNAKQTALWLNSAEPGKEIKIGVLPFFHVFAMTAVMNLSIWYGMKIILLPKFDIDQVLKLIDKEKPTFFPAVPAIFNAIANHKDVGKYDFSSLKFCLAGGAPLPNDVKRLFAEKTGVKAIGEGYGLTESSPVATCNPINNSAVTGSIGQPLPATIIDIVDLETGVLLGIGEKGEICIKGPQVMKGYYNRQDATDKTIIDNRLHTGDVGYVDEKGFVYIVDRIKDLILVRGYNVYPRHVEEAIYDHPSVEECIVAGVPDVERGETVWAWIKPVDGKELSAEDMQLFLKDKISPIERPRKIIIKTTPLPKTTVGKLSRKDLLEQEGIKKS